MKKLPNVSTRIIVVVLILVAIVRGSDGLLAPPSPHLQNAPVRAQVLCSLSDKSHVRSRFPTSDHNTRTSAYAEHKNGLPKLMLTMNSAHHSRGRPHLPLTATLSDVIDEQDHGIKRRVKRSLTRLSHGGSYVHENYLDIGGKILQKTLLVELLLWTMIFTTEQLASLFVTSSSQSTATIGASLVQAGSLICRGAGRPAEFYHQWCSCVIMAPFLVGLFAYAATAVKVPFMLATYLRQSLQWTVGANLVDKFARCTLFPYAYICRLSGASDSIMRLFHQQPMLRVGFVVLLGPVVEEIMYRFCFDKFWKRTCRFGKRVQIKTGCVLPRLSLKSNRFSSVLFRNKSIDASSSEQHTLSEIETRKDSSPILIAGYPLWVLVSSFLFAGAHMTNWYSFNGSGVYLDSLYKLDVNSHATRLALAVGQYCFTFLMSLTVLSPLYIRGGLAAATGAHVMWNAFSVSPYVLWVNVLVRLVVRAWRKRRPAQAAEADKIVFNHG